MAEERGGMIVGDRVEARLDSLEQTMAELKGTVSQMDKRLSNVEGAINGMRQEISKDNRQVMWTVLGTWIATMLTILLKQ